jgi:hypothetical protein
LNPGAESEKRSPAKNAKHVLSHPEGGAKFGEMGSSFLCGFGVSFVFAQDRLGAIRLS